MWVANGEQEVSIEQQACEMAFYRLSQSGA